MANIAVGAAAIGCSPVGTAKASGRAAFIDAEGYGSKAVGGLKGKIIKVTTLADSGPGSLRACIDAKGPRVCVFTVAGLIRFTTERPVIRNPYLTIAGETAPGGGITLSHAGGPKAFTPLTIKKTHNIIVRHIRVRTDLPGEVRGGNDGINIADSKNIIIDHVSASWSLDENIGLFGQNDAITISSSIFAEGTPKHDKCALLASDPKGPQKISFVRNLCAHNGDRNPDVNVPPDSCVDVVNNVFYNAQSQFTEIWESYGGSPVNVVGNVYRRGPDTNLRMAAGVDRSVKGSRGQAKIYLEGNLAQGVPPLSSTVDAALVYAPVCPLRSEAESAAKAYERALSNAGAFPRDAVDQRVVSEVEKSGGKIGRPAGPIPAIAPGRAYRDEDGDGMADSWERANATDPKKFDSWDDKDGDGWTNFDHFLKFAHQQRIAGIAID
jgi:pectate lyase